MLTAQRRQTILDRLKTQGQVSVIELSQEWGVSEDTVRRDLRDLAEEGLVQRVHGGALPASAAVADYAVRETLSSDVKRALGRAAAALIRPGQLVAVDGGTSTLELVRALSPELTCTVLTHSPVIASELRLKPRIEVILLGGRLFRHSMVAVGSETAEAIARFRADQFFLGATGLRPDTGATTGDWEEAAVKRAFCRASAETVLMVSPEKWGTASPYQIVPASDLSTLVVANADEAALSPYRAMGLTIVSV
jgi:DeoR/GlpR family transcriptional regulator of sugar metabolism